MRISKAVIVSAVLLQSTALLASSGPAQISMELLVSTSFAKARVCQAHASVFEQVSEARNQGRSKEFVQDAMDSKTSTDIQAIIDAAYQGKAGSDGAEAYFKTCLASAEREVMGDIKKLPSQ
ncbi:hypothetical protein QCD74_09240 [Pseudomonas syringae pv. actinidiae]|uniref:hypothetical protein n=1 Tax=Pseudomonas syringae TaxID=317 RepID=UPI002436DBA6|nr:hypothetical protein [Pseudomonas syringae]MDG6423719.1 hypothetical protein [Pseudomonas syringae pv. actinidiae]